MNSISDYENSIPSSYVLMRQWTDLRIVHFHRMTLSKYVFAL
jgi:hypothetical protein